MHTDFQGKKVTVMGLGLYKKGSGIEAVKFFLRQGAAVTVTDLRSAQDLKESVKEATNYWVSLRHRAKSIEQRPKTSKPYALSSKLTFIFGKHREEDFRSADLVFQNPSVPAASAYLRIAQRRKIPIVNDWSLFLSRHTPKLFVGVTGTRGKSTTTALIYEMLKKQYSPIRANRRIVKSGMEGGRVWLAGNLGVSPLAFIDAYRGEPIVAELSSWLLHHFSGPEKSPNVAVVTNIMNDHMDKYRSMREYVEDKENVFRFQNAGRSDLRHDGDRISEYRPVVVLNYDNPITRAMAKRVQGKVAWFSAQKCVPRWVPLEDLQIPGAHNKANALAAAVAAEAAGVPRDTIVSVLKTFHGLPGRLELVRTVDGVAYYNDTTATTPEATIAALKTLSAGNSKFEIRNSKRVVLICGGADKKIDYREMAKYVAKWCKAVVMLPGTATEKMKHVLQGQSLRARTVLEMARSMREAVRTATKLAQEGDVVLLSPAAASFGLFRNEFDRGKQFVDAVRKL